ncbi:MAG: ACT domain-containing protein [Candidatus Omnitrophota bacterium]
MSNVKKLRQLILTTPDKPGMLAEVTGVLAVQGVNIEAICAYVMKGEAIFYLVTQDNDKAKQALQAKGWPIKEEEVVLVEIENRPGVLANISNKLKTQNANLSYCYGTACTGPCACPIILKSDNNDSIIKALE